VPVALPLRRRLSIWLSLAVVVAVLAVVVAVPEATDAA
jgi:hypothetical protein